MIDRIVLITIILNSKNDKLPSIILLFVNILLLMEKFTKKILLLMFKTHSNNSKIARNININLIFCIINLIKTVKLEIISNISSFNKLLLELDPLI